MKNRDLMGLQQQLAQWQAQWRTLRLDVIELASGAQQARDAVRQMQAAFGGNFKPFEDFINPLRAFATKYQTSREFADRLVTVGWLPHGTSLFSFSPAEIRDEDLSPAIEQHYIEQFDRVRATFVDSAKRCQLGAECVSTVEEALSCIENQAYRSAVTLLFSEIERVTQAEFYSKGYHQAYVKGKPRGVTSLPGLVARSMELPGVAVAEFDFAFKLLGILETHLYENIGDDPALIEKCRTNPIPNRHAALHGIAFYKTLQNAINTLIMADFIFQLLATIRDHNSGEL